MNAVPFDTLKLADRLQAGGFTAEQAHTAASALAEVGAATELATKADLSTLATKAEIATLATKTDLTTLATKAEIATLATKAEIAMLATKAELQAVRADLLTSMAETKADILKWMVGAIGVQTAATIGAVIALVRLAH